MQRRREERRKLDQTAVSGPAPSPGRPCFEQRGPSEDVSRGAEGAVVWSGSLPAREHGFLGEALTPGRTPVGRASPPAAGPGRGVERCQGGELRQVALVEFLSILRVGGEAGRGTIRTETAGCSSAGPFEDDLF